MAKFPKHIELLKSDYWGEWEKLDLPQRNGEPRPEFQKLYKTDSRIIPLKAIDDIEIETCSVLDTLRKRRSRRSFNSKPLTFDELSFLLWATQGVSGPKNLFRTSPSAGARHPFETYLTIFNVEGVDEGIYRYLPTEHSLLFIREDKELEERVIDSCNGQKFAGECSVTFFWAAVPERTEWRYGKISHKMIAIDIGHVCQNLYLASESIGAGTCGIGAYDNKEADRLLNLDGDSEFIIYIAPVGKISY